MKKVYAVAIAALFAGTVSAQQIQPMAKTKAQDFRVTGQSVQTQVDREVFWTNDFSVGSDWTIGDAYDQGLTQFIDGLDWQIGNVEPTGFAPIAPLASTTAANGIAMVDSDLFGGAEGGTGIENCWIQTAQPIDCSMHPYVSISFETFYRMWDGGNSDGNEYCLVEVSTDGVNWPSLTTFEVSESPGNRWELWPDMTTQDPVNNPTFFTFDISSAAGGESTVWIRFRWKGTWGYAWMLDDVELFDTPEDDIRVDAVTYTDYNNTGIYEYGVIPFGQLFEMQFRSDFTNQGVNDQTNTVMDVSVNGTNVGTSDPITLAYASSDSAIVMGYTPPAQGGAYTVEYTISSDGDEESPENNTLSQQFRVSQWKFGRDNNGFLGMFPGDGTSEWVAAPLYQIFNDATVYAVDVAFMEGSVAGTEVIASLRDVASETFDPLVQSDELQIVGSLLNDGEAAPVWHTFLLEEPVEVFAGDFVMPAIEHYGGTNVQIGESRNAPIQTCFVYGAFPTFDWYYTTDVPMVRLNFDENAQNSVGVETISAADFTLGQNFPNPAENVTRISYSLENAERVSIEVFDITGKLVLAQEEGLRPAGEHVIDLSVSNLSAGTYSYTVTVGDSKLSRKMMVK